MGSVPRGMTIPLVALQKLQTHAAHWPFRALAMLHVRLPAPPPARPPASLTPSRRPPAGAAGTPPPTPPPGIAAGGAHTLQYTKAGVHHRHAPSECTAEAGRQGHRGSGSPRLQASARPSQAGQMQAWQDRAGQDRTGQASMCRCTGCLPWPALACLAHRRWPPNLDGPSPAPTGARWAAGTACAAACRGPHRSPRPAAPAARRAQSRRMQG